jgi:hypothetical protein
MTYQQSGNNQQNDANGRMPQYDVRVNNGITITGDCNVVGHTPVSYSYDLNGPPPR